MSCTENPDVTAIKLVPASEQLEILPGSYTLSQDTKIIMTPSWDEARKSLRHVLDELPVKGANNRIVFEKDMDLDPDSYHLNIEKSGIHILASDSTGAFYAVQSLRQILAQADTTPKGLRIPCLSITDRPEFDYRGMHLDVSRHFFTVEEVCQYIDLLALHKFNRFHWHLTDDQGWRIQIRQYPKLTEIGAYRDSTVIKKNTGKYDGIPHGGYYSQEDIKKVVKYAAGKCIEVIPEIEMPGHSSAALAAYPELGCTDGPYEVQKTWGVFEDVYCAGDEDSFTFITNVLQEVVSLFPGRYIHIGGDECPKTAWKACAKCQKRISEEDLKNEKELQAWFIQRIADSLRVMGKQLIGWDEILEGGLADNAIVMSWRGEDGGIEAARSGHYAIMTPNPVCYFDHYQSEDTGKEPFAIGGYTPVKEVYEYHPIPRALNDTEEKYILGVQGNLWTEYITDIEHLQYMALPRMAALSEVCWRPPDDRDYSDFIWRVQALQIIYDKNHYHYAKHIFEE